MLIDHAGEHFHPVFAQSEKQLIEKFGLEFLARALPLKSRKGASLFIVQLSPSGIDLDDDH